MTVTPLRPSNCGFTAAWSEVFRKFEGAPLKRIAISFAGRSARGEAMVTREGLEGGAIYALSSPIRDAIERDGEATIAIDLLPDVSASKLAERLSGPRGKQSLSNFLRKATHLSPAALSLIREAALSKGLSLSTLNAQDLAGLIKSVPVRLTGVQPIATAISTAGGISFSELDDRFMLRRLPGVFVAGEMLDWDAPTGGYLLQASFATGAAAGRGALAWLRSKKSTSIRADREITQPQVGEAALLPQPEQRPVDRLAQQIVAAFDRDADALAEEAAFHIGPAAEHAAAGGVGAVEPERERDAVAEQQDRPRRS